MKRDVALLRQLRDALTCADVALADDNLAQVERSISAAMRAADALLDGARVLLPIVDDEGGDDDA